MPITLSLDTGTDKQVLLMPRHQGKYAKVGVIADVTERVQLPGRGVAVSMLGLHRAIAGAAETDRDGRLRVEVDERPDQIPAPMLTHDLERQYRAVVEEILELRGDDGRLSAFVKSITNIGALADTAGYAPDFNTEQKIELLETLDVTERLKLALKLQQERLTELHLRQRIRDEVESGAQKQQREYLLRRQMEAIRKELGENEGSVIDEYRKKIAEAQMPEAVQKQAERELSRLERMGDSNAEALDDPHVPGLADCSAVVQTVGRTPGSEICAGSSRCGPCGSGRRQASNY
jgi:ATP-dependent Lon protease